jgi:hypothetical protein
MFLFLSIDCQYRLCYVMDVSPASFGGSYFLSLAVKLIIPPQNVFVIQKLKKIVSWFYRYFLDYAYTISFCLILRREAQLSRLLSDSSCHHFPFLFYRSSLIDANLLSGLLGCLIDRLE